MKDLQVGGKAADFALQGVRCGDLTLSSEVRKGPVLLYFYPVNYGMTCTNYIALLNESFDEFERLGIRMFHINPGSVDDHEKWMDRTGSRYDHLSDTDQNVSKGYGMIVTHPEHPKVAGFTNRGFVLVDSEMTIRYLWRANRPTDTIDPSSLLEEMGNAIG